MRPASMQGCPLGELAPSRPKAMPNSPRPFRSRLIAATSSLTGAHLGREASRVPKVLRSALAAEQSRHGMSLRFGFRPSERACPGREGSSRPWLSGKLPSDTATLFCVRITGTALPVRPHASHGAVLNQKLLQTSGAELRPRRVNKAPAGACRHAVRSLENSQDCWREPERKWPLREIRPALTAACCPLEECKPGDRPAQQLHCTIRACGEEVPVRRLARAPQTRGFDALRATRGMSQRNWTEKSRGTGIPTCERPHPSFRGK